MTKSIWINDKKEFHGFLLFVPDWQGWLWSHKHLRASSLHLYSKFSYSLCVYHSCIERMKLKIVLSKTKWKNLSNNKAKKNKYIVVVVHRYRFDAADFLHSRGSWWPDDVRSFVQTIVTQLLQSESCLITKKIGVCHHDVSAKFYLFLCIVGWCNLFTSQIIFVVLTQRFFVNATQSVRKLSCTENSVTLVVVRCVAWSILTWWTSDCSLVYGSLHSCLDSLWQCRI